MGRDELIRKINEQLKLYPVEKAMLFGSFARGENSVGSDIDMVVQFSKLIDLFTFVALRDGLQKVTKRKVDLLSEHALSPAFRKRIAGDLVLIYEA